MIKILEDLKSNRTKNIKANIDSVVRRLNAIKENLPFNEEKYDLDALFDILGKIYDDIGDFAITVDGNPVIYMWGGFMNNPIHKNNQFMNYVIFAKETIKALEDSIYLYYPKSYCDDLPLLHKSYDSLALALYHLNKLN